MVCVIDHWTHGLSLFNWDVSALKAIYPVLVTDSKPIKPQDTFQGPTTCYKLVAFSNLYVFCSAMKQGQIVIFFG